MTDARTRARTPLAIIAGLALAGAPLAAVAAVAQDAPASEQRLISAVEGDFEIDGNIALDGTGDYDWENYPAELQSFLYDNGSREAACSDTAADDTIIVPGTKADSYPFEGLVEPGQMHDKSDLCAVRQAIQTIVTTDDAGAESYQHLYHVMITVATGKGEESVLQFLPAGEPGPEGDLMIELNYNSDGEVTTPYLWVYTNDAWTGKTPLTGGDYLVAFATGVRPESDGPVFKPNEAHYRNTAIEYTLDLSALNADYNLYGDAEECISYAPGDFASITGEGKGNDKTPTMKDILRNDWTIETCVEETPTPTPSESETTTPPVETTTPPTETGTTTPIPTTTEPTGTETPATTAPVTPVTPGTTPPSLASTGGEFDFGVLAAALALVGGGAMLAMRRLGRDRA